MVDLDVRLLRSLLSVHDQRTVTAAAAALGYTPSAISQHLARLERDVGVDLIRRVGRNVELTDAGHALIEESAAVFAALDRAQAAAASAGGAVAGTVRIGTFQSAAVALIPTAVRDIQDRYPAVTVEIAVQETATSLHDLATGRLDLVIDQDYADAPHAPRSGTERHHLIIDPLCLATPEGWPRPERLTDLRDRPWILPHPATNVCGRVLIQRCREAGFEPDTRFWISDYLLGLNFAAAGLGVAVVSPLVSLEPPSGVLYNTVDPPLSRSISALTRQGHIRPAIEALLDSLRSACATVGRKD